MDGNKNKTNTNHKEEMELLSSLGADFKNKCYDERNKNFGLYYDKDSDLYDIESLKSYVDVTKNLQQKYRELPLFKQDHLYQSINELLRAQGRLNLLVGNIEIDIKEGTKILNQF
jgi:hypothetical protein